MSDKSNYKVASLLKNITILHYRKFCDKVNKAIKLKNDDTLNLFGADDVIDSRLFWLLFMMLASTSLPEKKSLLNVVVVLTIVSHV